MRDLCDFKSPRLFKATKDLSRWSLTDIENGVGVYVY